MKNNKSILAIAISLLAIFLFTACDKGEKTSQFGNLYEVHISNGGETPKAGEYVEFHYAVRLDDSLVENSRLRGDAIMYQMPDLDEVISNGGQVSPVIDGLSLIGIGDSITIFNTIESLPMVPEGFESFENVYYDIVLLDILTKEEYDEIESAKFKEQAQKRAALTKREASVQAMVADVLERYKSGALKDSLQTTDSGLEYVMHKVGDGDAPAKGQQVKVNYYGVLKSDGTMFDNSFKRGDEFSFTLGVGQVIPGWDEGIALLRKGGAATLFIPSDLGYGDRGAGPTIPPGSDLVFYVELLK